MTTETRIILKASEGMIITDGEIYGRTIYLGNDRTVDEFHEITLTEYDALMATKEAE